MYTRSADMAAQEPLLDGLRGLAALMVVASHASGLGLNLLPGLALTGIGKYGVYLFFVLSAYLLTCQWLRAWESGKVDLLFLRRYAQRRVLRIYPLYALVLLAGWALAPRGLGVPLDGAAVWRHLSLQEGRDLYWSIPVEFLYYLLLPVVAWLLTQRHWWSWGCLLAGLALLLWLWPPAQAGANSTQLAYYLPIFICGSVAARLAGGVIKGGAKDSAYRWIVMSPFDLLLLALLLLSVPAIYGALGLSSRVDALHRSFLGWGLFWSLVLLALGRGMLPLWAKLLGGRFWRCCGRWCFGLYLLHMPALYLAKRLPLPATTLNAWLGLGLALLLAWLAHRWIERPCQRLANR